MARSGESSPDVERPDIAVSVTELSLWYGDFRALVDVSAAIPRGKVTAMIGPSGCGKTTLLRTLNRINERYPNVRVQGDVRIHGASVFDPAVSLASLRKTVGMVFQRPNPLPMSIRENVAFGLRTHLPRSELSKSVVEDSIESALRHVGLWDAVKDRLDADAIRLTLEQQQKLCIARLLPLKPEVLLMDEPCSALDARGIEQIEALIGSLKGEFTILVVTHSMAQARRISDECLYMLLGEVIEHGPTLDVFERPRDDRTASYVAGRYG